MARTIHNPANDNKTGEQNSSSNIVDRLDQASESPDRPQNQDVVLDGIDVDPQFDLDKDDQNEDEANLQNELNRFIEQEEIPTEQQHQQPEAEETKEDQLVSSPSLDVDQME